jgi:hypothetical protein
MIPQLEIQFEPAFVYPSERYEVIVPVGVEVEASDGSVRKSRGKWFGTASGRPVEIWAKMSEDGRLVDVTKKSLKIAARRPRSLGDTAFAIVELNGGSYGAILEGKRFADLISFDLAPRSAPSRLRPYEVDYVYLGPDRFTLSGMPDGLMRTTITATKLGIEVEYSGLFSLKGTVRILGTPFQIRDLKPAEVGKISYPFP